MGGRCARGGGGGGWGVREGAWGGEAGGWGAWSTGAGAAAGIRAGGVAGGRAERLGARLPGSGSPSSRGHAAPPCTCAHRLAAKRLHAGTEARHDDLARQKACAGPRRVSGQAPRCACRVPAPPRGAGRPAPRPGAARAAERGPAAPKGVPAADRHRLPLFVLTAPVMLNKLLARTTWDSARGSPMWPTNPMEIRPRPIWQGRGGGRARGEGRRAPRGRVGARRPRRRRRAGRGGRPRAPLRSVGGGRAGGGGGGGRKPQAPAAHAPAQSSAPTAGRRGERACLGAGGRGAAASAPGARGAARRDRRGRRRAPVRLRRLAPPRRTPRAHAQTPHTSRARETARGAGRPPLCRLPPPGAPHAPPP
jgi:hypothetical protein